MLLEICICRITFQEFLSKVPNSHVFKLYRYRVVIHAKQLALFDDIATMIPAYSTTHLITVTVQLMVILHAKEFNLLGKTKTPTTSRAYNMYNIHIHLAKDYRMVISIRLNKK